MSTRNLPAAWVPNASTLLQQRPELAGIGLTPVAVELVQSC